MKRTQISTNVSELTRQQVDELMDRFGYSLRDVVTIAVDRLYQQEMRRLPSTIYHVVADGESVATYDSRYNAQARALIEKRSNPEAEIEVVEKDLPEYLRARFGISEFDDPRVVLVTHFQSKPRSVK